LRPIDRVEATILERFLKRANCKANSRTLSPAESCQMIATIEPSPPQHGHPEHVYHYDFYLRTTYT